MVGKKVLAIVLPTVACISLVGAGFCSWYFGSYELEVKTQNISVFTSSTVEKGTVSLVKSPSKVVFSQGEGDSNNLKDGIEYYSLNDDNSYTNNDEVTIKYIPIDKNDVVEGSSFRLYISFEGTTFPDIVKLSDEYQNATSLSGGYDFSKEIEVITTTSESEPYGYFKYTLNLKDAIEYKSVDVKPLSKTTYDSLLTALKDAVININFVVI